MTSTDLRIDDTPAAGSEAQALHRWWTQLTRGAQDRLRQLRFDEALPLWMAADLRRHGVICPLALVEDHDRLVRRSLPPRALQDFLTQTRHSAA